MSTRNFSNDTEVSGELIHVMHVDESGTDPVRTVLALAGKDDLSLSADEDTEDFNPAAERRTRRYRTTNTGDFELSSVMAADMEALELIGLVDASDGSLTFDNDSRQLKPADNEFIEISYHDTEAEAYADAQLVHRLEDVETMSPEVSMSDTPPVTSFTMMVHGAVIFNYTP